MPTLVRNTPFDVVRFILLFIVTLGWYAYYFYAKRLHEQSQYLSDIRELLIASHQREDQRSVVEDPAGIIPKNSRLV